MYFILFLKLKIHLDFGKAEANAVKIHIISHIDDESLVVLALSSVSLKTITNSTKFLLIVVFT